MKARGMSDQSMKAVLRTTGALSDRQRVRIVMMLGAGELCVCQIIEVLALAPSTVSKHLSLLSAAGMLDSRKDGRWMYYRLAGGVEGAQARPVMKWLADGLKDDAVIAQDRKALKRALSCDPESLSRRQRARQQEVGS